MACRILGKILGVLLLSSFSLGSNLTAIRVNDKLPTPMNEMSVFYDGISDFIYLFGGNNETNSEDSILRFDISNEVIEGIAKMPFSSHSSAGVHDSESDLFYFNAVNRDVYKFQTTNNIVTKIGSLTNFPLQSASAKNSAGNVLLFGGTLIGSSIIEVHIESETVTSEVVGRISEPYHHTVCVQLANNTALIFGSNGRVPYVTLNLETLESRNVGTNGFPQFVFGMTVTSDQDFVYVFGERSNPILRNGIIRLELATNSWEFISIDNFLTDESSLYYGAPEVVWVEKQNRIYMFGGRLQNSSGVYYLDDIWYLDLNPLDSVD